MTGHGEKGWGGHFDPHLAAAAAALSYIGLVHVVALLPFNTFYRIEQWKRYDETNFCLRVRPRPKRCWTNASNEFAVFAWQAR